MNYEKSTIDELEIQQYIDCELDEAQNRAIGERIASDAGLREKVEGYRQINRMLHQAYDDILLEPVPERILLALGQPRRTPAWSIAASLLWLGIGGLLGYTLHGQLNQGEFLRPLAVEAAYAHTVYVPEVRHPVEVTANEQDHLNAWLSKRLDKPIEAPDLRELGYTLIGGRLLPDGHRAAAQFMFEDSSGERMTLYIRQAPKSKETALLHAESSGLGIVYWIDSGLAYALTAAAEKSLLTLVATAVYQAGNP